MNFIIIVWWNTKCSIIIIFCNCHIRKNFLNWQIIKKTSGIWIKIVINVLFNLTKILFSLLNIPNLSTWLNVCCNGIAMMVLSVKKHHLKRHLLFLYLRQVIEWQWVWKVLTNWSKWLNSDGNFPQTAESKNSTYSFILFSASVGALSTQRKLCICSEPRNWNSTRIALYLTFPNGPYLMTDITLKEISTLWWKSRANKIAFEFKMLQISK